MYSLFTFIYLYVSGNIVPQQVLTWEEGTWTFYSLSWLKRAVQRAVTRLIRNTFSRVPAVTRVTITTR